MIMMSTAPMTAMIMTMIWPERPAAVMTESSEKTMSMIMMVTTAWARPIVLRGCGATLSCVGACFAAWNDSRNSLIPLKTR